MLHKAAFLLPVVALSLPISVQAKTAANLAEEYEQVRAIAQRDPKVRAAYEAADRRLADKIVEIDPALKGYTPGKTPAPTASAHAASATAAKPTTAKKQHAATASGSAKTQGATHTVAKGETIDGIAIRYHVSAASIKSANHIQDERKLAVGQKLVIPAGKATSTAKAQPVSAPAAAKPTETKSQGFWDKFKF